MKKVLVSLLVFSFLLIPVYFLQAYAFSASNVNLGQIETGVEYGITKGKNTMRMFVYNNESDEICMYPNVSYHHMQPEHEIPASWFDFDSDLVCLQPGEWFSNYYRMTAPVGSEVGDYFAYVEMCKQTTGNIGTCSAIKFRFEI